ncbi:hypothetical protein D1227_15535 [Henriciella mobilis]|uniref:hypothetical protein n=1 Tax=Henriciella mobilis TaxID=2305467 RepID=UPI000E67327A|nr:hypothetical protein [Henriciella mobilis]RIJ14367.1 hypothetical protein D1231_16505 [Henriciella mobilis]RIJ19805.1 hypothetical protein D1227_15535 [Henriciella mobilis]
MKAVVAFTISCAALLAACASHETGAAANRAVSETRSGATTAAMTPLRDLNLQREPIPAILQEIENPYDIPADISCPEIEQQVAALNEVLGPDWDALPRHEADPTVSDYAADEASEEVLDIIADEAGAIIPYRSWVRRLSGAKAYQKKVSQAEKRGSHRRTYLKALGFMKGCEGLAAPYREPSDEALPVEPAPPPVDFVDTTPPQYRPASADASAPVTPNTGMSLEETYDWPEEWPDDKWSESPADEEEASPASDGTSSPPSDG